jgi:cell division protein FtsQ
VLTGISADDPISTRAARMKIYLDFMAALDATGEGISHRLSEVDVSNPEDVKAIGSSSADVLVHFGEEKYLERYHQYQKHVAEWRAQYPKLASVDMRYEQQVVLEMQKDTGASASSAAASDSSAASAGRVAGASNAPHSAKIRKPAAKLQGRAVVSARTKKASGAPLQGTQQ